MELAEKKSVMKARFVPSIVQPNELSGRPDSSSILVTSGSERGRPRQEKMAVTEAARLRIVDEKRVQEAVTWIAAKVASTLRKGAEDVGEYVLDTFFAGDPELAKSRTPNKSASYRALAERCGTPDLPISKTWLNNAVGVVVMLRRLPASARAFRTLPPSYQERLLPLRDPEKVERVAEQAASNELTCRELRQVVANHLAKATKPTGGDRPRTPSILKKLGRSTAILRSDGKVWFSKSEIDAMDDEQKRVALRSAETLVEKLKDLTRRLRKQ